MLRNFTGEESKQETEKMRIHRKGVLQSTAAILGITLLSACQPNTPVTDSPVETASSPDVPQTESPQTDDSCYVHLFDGDNFSDDNDIIYGAAKWSNLRDLPGATETDWTGGADSLKVGPSATVKVWEKENFQGRSQTFGPNAQEPKLDTEPRSMEITCQ